MTDSSNLKHRVLINQSKCDQCASRPAPACAEACHYGAIYPDANSNYVWADCVLYSSGEECRKCANACPRQAIEIKKVPTAKARQRKVTYFETPGIQNTDLVVDAITQRVADGDIEAVVVASCSSSSALLLAKVLKDWSVRIINVSMPKEAATRLGLHPMTDEMDQRLSDLGVIHREEHCPDVDRYVNGYVNFPDDSPFYDWQTRRELKVKHVEKVLNETLIGVGGMGLKTAVECMLSACRSGDIAVGQKVISTAGTGIGLDTAAVIRATTPEKCFGKKLTERLEIREILAMPIRKHRWG